MKLLVLIIADYNCSNDHLEIMHSFLPVSTIELDGSGRNMQKYHELNLVALSGVQPIITVIVAEIIDIVINLQLYLFFYLWPFENICVGRLLVAEIIEIVIWSFENICFERLLK